MMQQTKLYLWEPQRELFKKDITDIKELFLERINPIFSNAEQEAKEYKESLWKNLMEQTCHGEKDIFDPADFVDHIEEEGFKKYEMLFRMQYRTIAMWISCISQVWEQQLYSFITQEGRKDGIKYDRNDKEKGFNFIQKVFKYHNQPLEELNCWEKIKELRLLVNVIKHAEGGSEKKLREIRPDYFIFSHGSEKMDLLKMYSSTLLEPTLQIQKKDFVDYYNALIEFWDELPEFMFSTDEV